MAKSLFSQWQTAEDVQQIRWEYELELLGCDMAHHGFHCKPSNTIQTCRVITRRLPTSSTHWSAVV